MPFRLPNLVASTTWLAPGAEDLAERALGPAVSAINVRRVEQRDAGFDGCVHHGPRSVHVQPAAEVVTAEPGYGYHQSRMPSGL